MRYKLKKNNSLKKYFFCLFSIIALIFIVATSNKKNVIVASNINTVKSIESSRIIVPEKEEVIEEVELKEEYVLSNSVNDIKNNQDKKQQFNGTITGYGPDCIGCSGVLACPPHMNVLNNNIYYTDNDYGVIRILAADPNIPCGSIIKVSNYDNQEFLGIVLDRGRDIHGLTMDLLFESENTNSYLGRRYNINFKIERWGY